MLYETESDEINTTWGGYFRLAAAMLYFTSVDLYSDDETDRICAKLFLDSEGEICEWCYATLEVELGMTRKQIKEKFFEDPKWKWRLAQLD